MRLALPAVLAFLLLAGCSNPPAADEAPADTPVLAPGEAAPVFARTTMRFAGDAMEAATSFSGTFGMADQCVIQVNPATQCSAQSNDITDLVPAGTPVQLTLKLTGEAGPGGFIFTWLDLQDASASRYITDETGKELTAVVVRQPSGTVAAVAQQSFPSLAPPKETPFTLDVRAVVRPDVLPTFLPAAVELQRGDILDATSDGLTDFVVIPPGRAPIHHLGPFAFNVTEDLPAGRYVVVAKGGGEVTLRGPNRTLEPLQVQVSEGEPHPLTSGQPATWDFAVEGIPLYVGFTLRGAGSPLGDTTVAQTSAQGSIVLTEGPVKHVEAVEGCCSFNVIGSSSSTYFSDYLGEQMGLGPFTITANFQIANGVEVHEIVAWVTP